MIKNYNSRKLGRTSAHRKALLRNLATSLFLHEKIKTTLPKAKELIRYSDRIISDARPNDLNAKKKLAAEIKNEEVRKKISEVLVPRYSKRPGGYARIYKIGTRAGDRAEMAIVKLMS